MKNVLRRLVLFNRPISKLEVAITDYCNLACPLCSHGVPLFKSKEHTSFEEIERLSRFFKPYEFDVIKISGGEPTLHPEFGKICNNLRRIFPAFKYELATNGFRLLKFPEETKVFDSIELTHYPGRNERIEPLDGNTKSIDKRDYIELVNIYCEKNIGKSDIFNRCNRTYIKKIVRSRIYPCCLVFGKTVWQGIDRRELGVDIDENWRSNLNELNIEKHCETCWEDVGKPSPFNFLDLLAILKTRLVRRQ